MRRSTFHLFPLAFCFATYAQDAKLPTGTIEFLSNELSGIVKKDAKVEIVAGGFQFTEGPLWIENEKMLLLSDVPGNTIFKWTEVNGKEVFAKPGGYTDTTRRGGFMGPNGLIISPKGKLWICQHGDRRIAEMNGNLNSPTSTFTTIVGDYDGKRLNSPTISSYQKMATSTSLIRLTDSRKGHETPKRNWRFRVFTKEALPVKLLCWLIHSRRLMGSALCPMEKL